MYTTLDSHMLLHISMGWTTQLYHNLCLSQAALKEAKESLDETLQILNEAKARLREVEEGIAALQAKYEECVAKKEDLKEKCDLCSARLTRAEKVSEWAVHNILLQPHSPLKTAALYTVTTNLLPSHQLLLASCSVQVGTVQCLWSQLDREVYKTTPQSKGKLL